MSYKTLKSYNQTTIIYDFTVEFCDRYIDKFSRTHDQMVQAARSGRQNIAEGSAQRNPKGETMLTKVARGSLEELLKDYEDFLRQRKLPIWSKDSEQAQAIRALAYKSDKTCKSYQTYSSYLSSPEKAANTMICLINQTNFLLDHQIASLEEKLISGEVGGISHEERLRRLQEKRRKKEKDFDKWIIDNAAKDGYVKLIDGRFVKKEEAEKKGLELWENN